MWGDNMSLKEKRISYGLSQLEASSIIDVNIRTYRRYESDDSYGDELKRRMFMQILDEHCLINEEKGLLSIETIKSIVGKLFTDKYKDEIDFCYLFGSYAKGKAKENSDVDLYVSSSLTGLDFVGLIEELRLALHKKVDVIRSSELSNNISLVNEIMKSGIKIYG